MVGILVFQGGDWDDVYVVGALVCGLSNAAYKRPDDVYVVPITALKD